MSRFPPVALISSTNHASLNVVRANNFAFMGFVVDSDNEELEKWVREDSVTATILTQQLA
ncbi:hypothetical protein [Aeromonas schubertii]|uniref:hypothetical protein n=1 Tax=Aeromonas schubertii TaxID=652 RepID=UPI0010A7D9B0|nr:hypothetical protein [Aeromonas schubertii]QCG48967.1 hypothetical protein E2P79_15055 [Aeromonas schubertii]